MEENTCEIPAFVVGSTKAIYESAPNWRFTVVATHKTSREAIHITDYNSNDPLSAEATAFLKQLFSGTAPGSLTTFKGLMEDADDEDDIDPIDRLEAEAEAKASELETDSEAPMLVDPAADAQEVDEELDVPNAGAAAHPEKQRGELPEKGLSGRHEHDMMSGNPGIGDEKAINYGTDHASGNAESAALLPASKPKLATTVFSHVELPTMRELMKEVKSPSDSQPPTPSMGASEPISLQFYSLEYHTPNKLIICRECCDGIPLNSVPEHLRKLHGAGADPLEDIFETLTEKLISAGIDPSTVRSLAPIKNPSKQWQESAFPKVLPHPYTPNLPILDAMPCSRCVRGFRSSNAWLTHWKNEHPELEKPPFSKKKMVVMQSFSSQGNLSCYFPISGIPKPKIAPTLSLPSVSSTISMSGQPSEVVSLNLYNLGFNPENSMLVCLGCTSGIFYCLAHRHVIEPVRNRIEQSKTGGLLYHPVAHGFKAGSKHSFQIALNKALEEHNINPCNVLQYGPQGSRPSIEEWDINGHPPLIPAHPIEGIPIIWGFLCAYCWKGFTHMDSRNHHIAQNHRGKPLLKDKTTKPMQTLVLHGSYKHYYEVLDLSAGPSLPSTSAGGRMALKKSIYGPEPPPEDTDINSLVKQLEMTAIGDLRPKLPTPSQKTSLHPFLVREQIDEFLMNRSLSHIFAICNPSSASGAHPWFQKLMALQRRTFDIDINATMQVSSAVRWQVATTNRQATYRFSCNYMLTIPTSNPPSKPFTPPMKKESRRKYYRAQTSFVWAMICGYRLPKQFMDSSGRPLFSFLPSQADAIRDLISKLDSPKQDTFGLSDALYRVLYQIYFPPLSESEDIYMVKKWADPFAVFCACLWIGRSGAYRPIFDVPPFLAQLQCSIRLTFIRYVLGSQYHEILGPHGIRPIPEPIQSPKAGRSHLLREAKSNPKHQLGASGSDAESNGSDDSLFSDDSGVDDGDDDTNLNAVVGSRTLPLPGLVEASSLKPSKPNSHYSSIIVPLCDQYLREQQITPFAFLRDWMRSLTQIVFHTPRPYTVEVIGHQTIGWGEKHCQLSWNGLATTVQTATAELMEYIKNRVLHGAPSGLTPHLADLGDSLDLETIGYNPFVPPGLGEESNALMRHLLTNDILGEGAGKSLDNLDVHDVITWLNRVQRVWSELWPLIHITSGPPSRRSEQVLFQLSNTIQSRRHVTIENNILSPTGSAHPEVVVFTTNYNKSGMNTGAEKANIKVLPYAIGWMLVTMLRAVRPVERLLACRFMTDSEKIPEVLQTCQDYLYVTAGNRWNEENLSGCLTGWFVRRMNLPMNIRTYRHVSIMFDRLEYRAQDQAESSLGKIAEEGTGHSQVVGEMNYARTREDGVVAYSDRLGAFKVCTNLHKRLGLATTEDEWVAGATLSVSSQLPATPGLGERQGLRRVKLTRPSNTEAMKKSIPPSRLADITPSPISTTLELPPAEL